MKKIRFFAVVLAVITVATLFLSLNVSAEPLTWEVDLGEKVNVLRDNAGLIQTPAVVADMVDVATDGKQFGYGKGPTPFINIKAYENASAGSVSEASPGTFEFKMTNGSTKAYYYQITWADVYADVNSFDMYFSGENHYVGDEKEGKLGVHLPNYHIDAEFDILVSLDDGKTWEVAWESNRFATDPNSSAIVTGCAGFTEAEMAPGVGDPNKAAVEVKYADPADPTTVLTTYRIIKGEFNKEYKNVTNVAYAASRIRRNGAQTVETWTDENKTVALTSVCTPAATPFWYVARISEFEVFGKKNEKPATTEAATTEAPATTAAPAATTAAPAATTAAPAATTAAPSTEKTAEKSGCGSVAAYGVCMIVTALGAAFIRKKH